MTNSCNLKEMGMKTVLLATVISGLTASTSVLAAGEFEGPWVGAGMGFRGQNTKVTDNNTGQEVDGLGKNSIFGVLQGGYAWRYGDWNIGPYGFYLIGTTTSDVVTPNGGFFNGTTSFEMKWKNQWGIGFQPGYYLSDNTVMYLKMSYNRTKAELTVNTPSGSLNPSENFGGPGIGLGMKHELSNNVILWVDAQQQYYSSKTFNVAGSSIEVKPKMTMGMFGIGYQF
jgi:hypothetical protein